MIKRSLHFRNQPEKDYVLSGWVFKYDELASYWTEERMSPDIKLQVSPDALLLRGHDPDKILGRVGVNLEFENRDEGLYFKVSSLPDTELGRETKTLVNSKLLSGVSVGFMENKSRTENNVLVFEDITIREISIVSFPCYDSGRIESKRAEIVYLEKKPYKKVTDTKQKPPDLIL